MKRDTARVGTPHAQIGQNPATVRFHYMDNLRALAMLAGILFHAAIAYSPMLSQLWLTASPQQSVAMDAVAWFSHLFRMPLFFLIAGFFACYLVGKRGIGGLLKNRLLRIALPFVLFLPLIWASFMFSVGWALENVANPSPMLGMIAFMAQQPDAPPPPVTTTHLWFLYVLFQFCLVYALLEKTGVLKGRWTAFVTRVPFVVFVLPLLMVPALVTVVAPTPAPEQFVPQAWAFGFFGLFFLLGALVFRNPDFLQRIRPWAPWLAVSSVALYAVVFQSMPREISLEQAMATQAGMPFSWEHLGIAVLEGFIAVHMTLVCLAVGQSLLDKRSRIMRLVADSSYWVYIVHLPVLFVIQFLLLDSGMNLWAQFLVSALGTFAVGFVSYLVLVRWTPIGWLLNGRRKRRQASEPGPLGGAAAGAS